MQQRRSERWLCPNGKGEMWNHLKKKKKFHGLREAAKTTTMLHCENEYIQRPNNQSPQRSSLNSWPAQPGIFLITGEWRPYAPDRAISKQLCISEIQQKWNFDLLNLDLWSWRCVPELRTKKTMFLLPQPWFSKSPAESSKSTCP